MKKVLILSYFYPPTNFVGAQRTAAWAKYLNEFGYYPIIITRQWNDGQTDLIDKQINNELQIEYNETHEVHRLPYKRSLRDRLSNYPFLRLFQKALTLKELILSNWRIKSLPFANFYTYSKELLTKDIAVEVVIASGRPFQAFFIGYQLKKDFPAIHWIPDYRDEWITRKTNKAHSTMQKWINSLEKSSEKKWTSNSSFFITVSDSWKNNISGFIKKPGIVITNGFDGALSIEKLEKFEASRSDLRICYLGSIYDYQDFSILFQAIQEINNNSDVSQIYLTFLGSFSNNSERKELERKTQCLGPNVSLENKVPQEFVQKYIEQADLLFLTEYINLEGCLPVKIFDYYNSNKPILLCPSDNDLMEKFIQETSSGFIANTVKECKSILEALIEKKRLGKPLIGPRNTKNAHFYTRKHQTKLLAEALDELIK